MAGDHLAVAYGHVLIEFVAIMGLVADDALRSFLGGHEVEQMVQEVDLWGLPEIVSCA